jgi:hypothetical protein
MENKSHPASASTEKKGGYPAGARTPGQGKPPPASMSKQRPSSK